MAKQKIWICTAVVENSVSEIDSCLFIPCSPAFFDLLISLGQQGLIVVHVKSGLNFSIWPNQAGVLVH